MTGREGRGTRFQPRSDSAYTTLSVPLPLPHSRINRGIVSCLKLSPNLRKRVEASAQYRSEAGISSDSPLQVFGALPFKPPAARTLLGERVAGPGSAAVPAPAPAAAEVALPSAEEAREAWCQAHRRQLEGPLEALRRVRSSVQKALDG